MGWPYEDKKAANVEVRRLCKMMGDRLPRGMRSWKLPALNDWIQTYYNGRGCAAAESEMKVYGFRKKAADEVAGHLWRQDMLPDEYCAESMAAAAEWAARFADVNDAIVGADFDDVVRRHLGPDLDVSRMTQRAATAILGTRPRCRYKKLCLTYHPDKGGDPNMFRAIVAACGVLGI